MYYVYVLCDEKSDKKYIGYTSDLKRRLSEHRNGKAAKFTQSGDSGSLFITKHTTARKTR